MRFAIALDERSDRDMDITVKGIPFIIDTFTFSLLHEDEVVIQYHPDRDSFIVATRHLRSGAC